MFKTLHFLDAFWAIGWWRWLRIDSLAHTDTIIRWQGKQTLGLHPYRLRVHPEPRDWYTAEYCCTMWGSLVTSCSDRDVVSLFPWMPSAARGHQRASRRRGDDIQVSDWQSLSKNLTIDQSVRICTNEYVGPTWTTIECIRQAVVPFVRNGDELSLVIWFFITFLSAAMFVGCDTQFKVEQCDVEAIPDRNLKWQCSPCRLVRITHFHVVIFSSAKFKIRNPYKVYSIVQFTGTVCTMVVLHNIKLGYVLSAYFFINPNLTDWNSFSRIIQAIIAGRETSFYRGGRQVTRAS